MTIRRPAADPGRLPPDMVEALAEILADALVADLVQYPGLGRSTAGIPSETAAAADETSPRGPNERPRSA